MTTSAAGLPRIRLHDVRHSYATAALAAGVPAKVVSERLGHANIAITMDTYSHVLPGLDELAAGTLARLILGDNDQASARPIDKPLTTGRTASEDGEEVKREPLVNDGASGGTRTPTSQGTPGPKPGASTVPPRSLEACGSLLPAASPLPYHLFPAPSYASSARWAGGALADECLDAVQDTWQAELEAVQGALQGVVGAAVGGREGA